ncbi:NAD(P)-dependent alcohol dehydrogenase [Desulfovibrio inopinatus]|uniref:NAD(P)-dependent alcohol dehydrogenase n=1 Tax=Desulfovibrio inopinatus TaxID=102109 RepID=UPI00042A4BD5|nr:NAD(P)-dependent alcohol dehydrogenase [Desulfovibrio inopinatus]
MKALVFTQYKSLEHLELLDVPDPQPKEDELLVRVHASSVNSWDWEYFSGVPFANRAMFGLFRPKLGKQRLGADIAGVVESIGPSVTRFKPGDEVFGDLWDCWGGFAELACIRETFVERKPANLSFVQAAAVPQAGVLALGGYRKKKVVRSDHKVLINGAGGGVGSFAIQLAKLDGAEVTGVDAPHKLDAIKTIGADHTLDYTQEDWAERGFLYDLIIDCNLSRPLSRCKRALAPGGIYAVIGGETFRILRIMLGKYYAALRHTSMPFQVVMDGPSKGLDSLGELLETNQLVPVLDKTFSLDKVPEALRYFNEGRHIGKIVITVR